MRFNYEKMFGAKPTADKPMDSIEKEVKKQTGVSIDEMEAAVRSCDVHEKIHAVLQKCFLSDEFKDLLTGEIPINRVEMITMRLVTQMCAESLAQSVNIIHHFAGVEDDGWIDENHSKVAVAIAKAIQPYWREFTEHLHKRMSRD